MYLNIFIKVKYITPFCLKIYEFKELDCYKIQLLSNIISIDCTRITDVIFSNTSDYINN